MEVLKAITKEDILQGKECPKDYTGNLEKLLKKINQLQTKYGKQFEVTSGFRSLVDHLAIYRKKGVTDPKKIPMKSKHLFCQAIDIRDRDGKLYKWCKQNDKVLEDLGLYCEEGTSGWMHFQIVPPASGRRWFLP